MCLSHNHHHYVTLKHLQLHLSPRNVSAFVRTKSEPTQGNKEVVNVMLLIFVG